MAYFCGGVSIGTFESNLLSCITPLGHATKTWAILGMPLGFNLISIAGLLLVYEGLHVSNVYWTVATACVAGAMVFCFCIPDLNIRNNGQSLKEFGANIAEYEKWLYQIMAHAFCLAVDMFSVSFCSAIVFYIMNGKVVPLYGAHTTPLLNKNLYFAVLQTFVFCGDFFSRKVVYLMEYQPPVAAYLVFSFAGVFLILAKLGGYGSTMPLLAPLGMFCVFYANGSIYAASTKFIDTAVEKKYNLIALSTWLFVGDCGSVLGSNVWQGVYHNYVCTKHFKHLCLATD